MRAEPDATSSLHAYSRRTTHAHRYKDAGPAGQATFEAGVAGFEVTPAHVASLPFLARQTHRVLGACCCTRRARSVGAAL